jgi:hypothetical protein
MTEATFFNIISYVDLMPKDVVENNLILLKVKMFNVHFLVRHLKK